MSSLSSVICNPFFRGHDRVRRYGHTSPLRGEAASMTVTSPAFETQRIDELARYRGSGISPAPGLACRRSRCFIPAAGRGVGIPSPCAANPPAAPSVRVAVAPASFVCPVPSGLFPHGHVPKVRPCRRAGYGREASRVFGEASRVVVSAFAAPDFLFEALQPAD